MAIEYLVPTANASTATALTTNDYTLIDDGAVNGLVTDADGSVNTTIADDWAGSTAQWTSLSTLSSDISSVSSATFRVRARLQQSTGDSDDTVTYTFRLTVAGNNYDITWVANTDNNAGFANRTVPVGTGFTRAQYEAATVTLSMGTYNKTKGWDGLTIDIDAFELEINYTPAANYQEADANAAGSAATDFKTAETISRAYSVSASSATDAKGVTITNVELSADGTSTTNIQSQFIRQTQFNIAGSSTVSADSAFDYVTQFTVAGSTTATVYSAEIVTSAYNVSGSSTTNFIGEDAGAGAPVEATASAVGSATVSGDASSFAGVTYTETGTSATNYNASEIINTAATSDGTSSTSFTSSSTFSVAWTSAGTSVAAFYSGQTTPATFGVAGSTTIIAQGQGISGVTVNPTEFDWDNNNVVISGSNFESTQGSGTVYLSDANTLAGSVNEVEIANAISTWSDTSIALNFTTLTQTELDNLEILGPGQRYLIVVNNSALEQGSEVLTVHRPKAIALSDSSFIPASGADTTPQLTPPVGKTIADFGGGRIQDDENPTDAVSTGPGEYREDEWAVIGLDASVYEKTYQFRVLIDGVVADTITITPELLITSGTTGAVGSSIGSATVNWYTEAVHGVTFALSATATVSGISSVIVSSEFTEVATSTTSGNTAQTNITTLSVSGDSSVQGYAGVITTSEFNEASSSTTNFQTTSSSEATFVVSGQTTTNILTSIIAVSEFTEVATSTTNGNTSQGISVTGSVSGSSTVQGYSEKVAGVQFSATGSSEVFGYTSESTFGLTDANASGSATVQGYTAAIVSTEFTETSTSTASGDSTTVITSTSGVVGSSTVTGFVNYTVQVSGSIVGTTTIDWTVAYLNATTFTVAGSSTVSGVGVIASGNYKRWNKVSTDDIASLNGIDYSQVNKINEVNP